MPKFNPSKSPNANILQNIQSKAVSTANARTTIDLDISLIDENTDNSYVFNMNEDELKRLAATIDKEGFYGIVEVYKKPDGRYELSSGHRRTRAAKSLGWKTIPAIVLDMPEEETVVRRKLVFSNINNRTMSPMDWARTIAYHKDTIQMELGIDGVNKKRDKNVNIMQIIAEDFGKSENTLHCYMRLNNLILTLQDYVDQELVPFRAMSECAKEDEEFQTELAIQIERMLRIRQESNGEKTPLTVTQIDGIINSIKNNKEVDIQPKQVSKPKDTKAVVQSIIAEEEISSTEEKEEYEIPVESMGKPNLFGAKLNDDLTPLEEMEKPSVVVIDKKVKMFANEFEHLLIGEYSIGDRDAVEKDLQSLEIAINLIRENMK